VSVGRSEMMVQGVVGGESVVVDVHSEVGRLD